MKHYLKEALAVNSDHPRTHYILGLEAKKQGDYPETIRHYQQAIAHYPPSNRYHFNEAYNNLRSAYFELGDYEKAKEAWEQGLVLLPADAIVRRNLIENIYQNPAMQERLRVMQQHLNLYSRAF